MKKPTLLIITTTFPRWNNDTDPPFVYELARRLTNDFNVIVHTPHYSGSKSKEVISNIRTYRFRYFLEKFEKLAGQVAILPFLKRNKGYWLILPFFLTAQLVSLYLLIRKVEPDVIHAHWLLPSGLFAVLCKGKTPVVVTGHGADVFCLEALPFRVSKQLVITQAQSITVVSNALKNKVLQIAQSKHTVSVLPMGVDSTVFNRTRYKGNQDSSSSGGVTKLLFVGRLSEKKGVQFLLEAFSHVKRIHRNIRLLIIGDGEEKEDLVQQAISLKIMDEITFAGALANHELPERYAEADIFIGPSIAAKDGDSEGFGLTFIEASFSGCFLIGSDIGGIRDIIQHEITGLLATPAASIDLAGKLCWAIEHPEKVEKMRQNAMLKHKKLYDWDVVAKKYSSELRRTLTS